MVPDVPAAGTVDAAARAVTFVMFVAFGIGTGAPWELGYFDALKAPNEQVYVMAIVEEGQTFTGQEYLGLYRTVDPATYSPTPPRVRQRSKALDSLAARLLREGLGTGRPIF